MLVSERSLLAAIVDSSNDAIVSKDLNGIVTSWNRAAEHIFGYTAEEMVGRPISVLAAPGGPWDFPAILERVRRGERVDHFETVRRAKDGRVVHASLTVSPVRDASGAIVGASKIARDITERKRAEEEIRRSEERFRALVTASSDAVYRMSPDWSELRHLVGREFIADAHEPSRAWLEEYIEPEDRPRVVEAAREAVRTRGTFELEHRVRRVDGTLGWTFSRAVPILDGRGEVVEWFGTASDITRRKEAESLRERIERESERQRLLYEAALSNTPDLVYIFDLDHRFIYANEALLRMWGRTREEALGKNCLELGYPAWHAEMHDRELDRVVATKRPIRGEVPFLGTNGRRIYDYIFVPVLGGRGEVVAVAGSTRDVTDRQQAEQAIREQAERLQENDRRKDEFLAMLAHELRNPLSAIGNAMAFTARSGPQEPIEWAMDVINRQMRHLTHLIDDLLDVSRINRGKIDLRRGVLELSPILDSALATAGPLIEERKHTLEVAIDRGDLWAEVDPTRLEQVAVNLLNNAAKYSDNGGYIRLSARAEGDEVVISVKDRGHGIPPGELPQMFELFTQGDRSLARSEGGLGIGLTVVKKLVEMHGGRVEAESAGPGRGSEFTIRLPRAARPACSGAERTPGAGGATRAARILVVDDNADTARGMARLLKLLGHEVRVAHDGPGAIEAALEFRPEFVLLDIGLPGMDGYEVASRLKREGSFQDAIIIAVSGYGQDHDRRRSKEAGFDHHLVKPVDHEALLTLLSAGGTGRG
jgi:PAS domain S-box-containing protein